MSGGSAHSCCDESLSKELISISMDAYRKTVKTYLVPGGQLTEYEGKRSQMQSVFVH